jgi:large subunit ribosomal protein L17
MRHKIAGNKLSRPTAHRLSLLANLVKSLVEHEQLTTTVAKAKALRPVAEKLITLGKKGGLANRRKFIAEVGSETIATKVFSELATRYKDRNGGYTRIIKTGSRQSDASSMAIIELVDRNIQAKGARDRAADAANKAAAS